MIGRLFTGFTAPSRGSQDEVRESETVDADADGSADRLRYALDSIEQGVVLFDHDGTPLFLNATARRYAEARDAVVLVGAAVEELLPGALAGRVERREVEIFGPPAQSFVVVVRPYTDAPGAGALALVEDRSLERRTETVRRDFVANISHELKTPIGALGLLAETIRDEPDPEVVRRLAQRMVSEADRAASTVDDLLELSSIEFGADAEFERLTVASVFAEASARIASAAEQAGVAVRLDVPAGLEIVGDRRQLVSALFNLLDNSVKYASANAGADEGGEVQVSADRDERSGALRIVVSDTGIGIPRRDLDRVFERFYRVDRARSRMTGGTGLGLAIVRHVMSNHQGEVSVESTEGIGSVFTLTFPGAP